MSVILLLIPLSIVIAACFLGAFIWAVRSGQYEDTTTPSMRVLLDDASGSDARLASHPSFPLTLALSPEEREQQPDAFPLSGAPLANPDPSVADSRAAILPLPMGEGRGEGKRGENSSRT